MKFIFTISLLLISFIGFSQKIINYDSLLIGRWIDVKDTRDSKSYQKLNLEIEYKTNGELISYQDGKIISTSKWKIEYKRIKKSIFLINNTLVLKLTKDKLVTIGCECNDYENNCPNKNCYKTTYRKVK